jgi:hypothetical protein
MLMKYFAGKTGDGVAKVFFAAGWQLKVATGSSLSKPAIT